jgi:DNA-binding NtrC family response regulator
MAALMNHRWPGNVRELQNAIERAVILCGDGQDLQLEHLGFANLSVTPTKSAPTASPPAHPLAASPPVAASTVAQVQAPSSPDSVISLSELEKRHILAVLEVCKGNRTHAAKKLGISIRTLRNKLHEYGVTSKEEPADDLECV